MEFCDGENLRSFIVKNKKNNLFIKEKILKNTIKKICMGIKVIHHNKKMVHLDLKPENIFMNDNMEIKLGNLDLSKQINFDKTNTKNKSHSDYYIAPELLIKGIYNIKSDIWSLGCIIYELFTLNIYTKDKFMNEIKEINSDIYNNKWQKLIDSLLQIDYKKTN